MNPQRSCMQRDREYLFDILEASRLAREYVSGVDREDFLADTKLQDAVIRRLEVIGEAARRVSDESRAAYQELPRKDMIGMRNFLVHDYDDVDMGIVWGTVHEHLPSVISRLELILAAAPSEENHN